MSIVLFFGLTTVDICNYVDGYPKSNGKVRAVEQLVYAGGPAANAAVSCAASGISCRLVSGLGGHPLARLAREDLRQHGVYLVDLQDKPDCLPVLSSITIDLRSGDRCVVYTNTEGLEISKIPDCRNLLHECATVMLDGYFIEQAVELAGEAGKQNIPVVLDGGSWKEGLDKLLPFVDYAVCSSDFYPPGCQSLEEVVAFLHGAGVTHVAVSRGPDPLVYSFSGQVGEISVPKHPVVDTLGAGDILHGAFCAFLQKNGFIESLRKAAEVAGYSCLHRGTRNWIQEYYR